MRLNPFRSSSRKQSSSWLKRETKFAIIGVVLIVFSIISLLSFFSAAGPSGNVILALLKKLFGVLGYLVPFGLGYLGWYLLRSHEEPVPRMRIVGILLLIAGLLGIFHVVGISAEDTYQKALEGKGGGLVGFLLSFPIRLLLAFLFGSVVCFFQF